MTQEHPITPPPELVKQWINESHCQDYCSPTAYLIDKVARWGYEQRGAVNEAELQKARDQELEACCEWLETGPYGFSIEATAPSMTKRLRAARRPKPPTLKERGREALQSIHNAVVMETGGRELDVLKEIVESLPD